MTLTYRYILQLNYSEQAVFSHKRLYTQEKLHPKWFICLTALEIDTWVS